MIDTSAEQFQPDLIESLPNLKKERVGDVDVYLIDFSDNNPPAETLEKLKRIIGNKKIAVELGPGNQLESMLFAAKKSEADVVFGVDPDFDLSQINPSTIDQAGNKPTVILFKGDAWGDTRIKNFFGSNGSPGDRLATYSQLVSPDTMAAERMIGAAIPMSNAAFMIVLDSGAVEFLENDHLPQGAKKTILLEKGLEDPTSLDWIKLWLRNTKQTQLTKQDYQQGITEGIYPPSKCLRDGNMLIFESQND